MMDCMTHYMAYSTLTLGDTGNVVYKCIKDGSGLVSNGGGDEVCSSWSGPVADAILTEEERNQWDGM